MNALIGYTGFVGSNLANSFHFEGLYNSQNVEQCFEKEYDTVVYAGVKAEKFLANQNPQADFEHIKQTIENIKRIKAQRMVLISTIDVYSSANGVNEDTFIHEDDLQPYGRNRYFLENWVKDNIDNATIVRLPALYGQNIKKNFIFDMMNMIPTMIKKEQFVNLLNATDFPLETYYKLEENGFYKVCLLTDLQKKELKCFFKSNSFNALSFTDSRNIYQFYPLRFLWKHIQVALDNQIALLCLNSEPVSASELYQAIFKKTFKNFILQAPVKYDLKCKNAYLFGGNDGYIFNKEFIIKDIQNFIREGE